MIADKIEALLADKGYDTNTIREEFEKAVVEAIIIAKSNRREPIPHNREKYRWRNLIGRLFNNLKNRRRIAPDTIKPRHPISAFSIPRRPYSGTP